MATGGDPRPQFLYPVQLTERGARAVGMWPSGDAGDVLLRALRRPRPPLRTPRRREGWRSRRRYRRDGRANFVIEVGVSVAKGATSALTL